MASLNRVVLIGRLTKDPEVTKTTSGYSRCAFTVAVDNIARDGGERTANFINCVSWNKTAEFMANYCKKGNQISVDGRLSQRSYEDKTGNKRSVIEVVAENVQLLERRTESDNSGSSYSAKSEENLSHEGIDATDEDLPF